MKKIKNYLLVAFILLFGLGAFFVFHVPDSVEARVNKLTEEISLNEKTEASAVFKKFMEQYEDKEKMAIFENLPFAVLKDNRDWLVATMNEMIPYWVESESFNAKYLLTELKLEEKRDKRVIKNLDRKKNRGKIVSFRDLIDKVYQNGKEHWNIEAGDFYVIDNSLSATIRQVDKKLEIESFKIQLFEIQNAYIFDVNYFDTTLTIRPSLKKFEDNGAYEFSEKLSFYELPRLKKYCSKLLGVESDHCVYILSDKLFGQPGSASGEGGNDYLNLKYNRREIELLQEIQELGELRYTGSLQIVFYDAMGENVLKQVFVNLFKDM